MNTTHAQQVENSIVQSLVRAGIGTSYHRRSLSERSPELVTWVTDHHAEVREGRGWNIVGKINAYDATILLARALHLSGHASLVLPLRKLVKAVEFDSMDMEQITSVEALFVTGFYDLIPGAVEPALKPWQVQDVEAVLTERLHNGKAVFAQASLALTGSTWWTTTFVDRINDANRTLVLK